ncbi:unnamed protein product [Arabidopsis halleri]
MSRIQWLQEGDQNTGFFHAVTKGRKAVNRFLVVEAVDSTEHFEEQQIAKTVADFYETLFTAGPISQLQVVEEAIQPQVTEAMNASLTKIPTDLEIHKASKIPSNASHGWRGIMDGREILKKGLGWVIGNGATVNVWGSPWLSTSIPLCPMGPPPLADLNLKVSDLLHPNTNVWNLEAIRLHLPQYEEDIVKLVMSSSPKPDRLRWLPVKAGTYISKSGYNLGKSSSSLSQVDGFN